MTQRGGKGRRKEAAAKVADSNIAEATVANSDSATATSVPSSPPPTAEQAWKVVENRRKSKQSITSAEIPPSPLVVRYDGTEGWNVFRTKLRETAGESFVVKWLPFDMIQLQFQTEKGRQKAASMLKGSLIKEHLVNYAKTKGKPKVYLLRGLPWFITKAEIEEEMVKIATRLTCCAKRAHVRRINTRTPEDPFEKRRSPVWMLLFSKDATGLDALLDVNTFLDFEAKIERAAPEALPLPQCYNCQEWGHIARHCRNATFCVKCGGNHASKSCRMSKEETPRCANCKEEHVSSWRGCTAFRSVQEARRERAQRKQTSERPGRSTAAGRQGPAPTRAQRQERADTAGEHQRSPAAATKETSRPPADSQCGGSRQRDNKGAASSARQAKDDAEITKGCSTQLQEKKIPPGQEEEAVPAVNDLIKAVTSRLSLQIAAAVEEVLKAVTAAYQK